MKYATGFLRLAAGDCKPQEALFNLPFLEIGS